MPERKNASGIGRAPFAYATIRVVPRVEREEFVNVGVVLYSRPRKYLGVQARLDVDRLRALWPELDLDAVARQLDVIRLVVAGDSAGGAIALLPAAERFGWLSAPASTVVQPGPVHAGLAADPEAALHDLFTDLAGSPTPC
jgi:pimeloyl-ACP methyl ester carboxylesterase